MKIDLMELEAKLQADTHSHWADSLLARGRRVTEPTAEAALQQQSVHFRLAPRTWCRQQDCLCALWRRVVSFLPDSALQAIQYNSPDGSPNFWDVGPSLFHSIQSGAFSKLAALRLPQFECGNVELSFFAKHLLGIKYAKYFLSLFWADI